MKLGLGGIGETFRDDNFRRYSHGSILSWTSYFVQAVAVFLHFGVVAAYATNVVGYGVFFGFVAFLRTPAGYVQPPASGKSFVRDGDERHCRFAVASSLL